MIGRGLIAMPDLARVIAAERGGDRIEPMSWSSLLPVVRVFFDEARGALSPRHAPGRLKQWLSFLRHQYPQAQMLFETIKGVSEPERIAAMMAPAG